jgi:hypothetical protein
LFAIELSPKECSKLLQARALLLAQEIRHETSLHNGRIRISSGAIGHSRLVRLCVDRKHDAAERATFKFVGLMELRSLFGPMIAQQLGTGLT